MKILSEQYVQKIRHAFDHNTISRKFLVPVLSLAVALLFGLGVLMAINNSTSMMSMLKAKGNSTADFITKFSSDYYAIFDFNDFENFVTALKSDPEIEFAIFYNIDKEPLTKIDERITDTSKLLIYDREIKDEAGNIHGYLQLGYNKKNLASSRLKNIFIITVSVLVAILLFSFALIGFIGDIVTRPIKLTKDVIKQLESGQLSTRLIMSQEDEIGQMAGSFNIFVEKLQSFVSDLIGTLRTLNESSDDLLQLSAKMSSAAKDVSRSSDNVVRAVTDVDNNMSAVASSTEQISTNVVIVASATDQMKNTIKGIADNADNARRITDEAVEQTDKILMRINDFNQSAQEITQITKTISDVSDETRILAFNATIEAARAGEYGRGFSVVASEIKELADKTSEETDAIKKIIALLQDKTTATVKDISQISDVISKVNEIVIEISTSIEEQTVTTKEIAGNIGQFSNGIQEVSESVNRSAHGTGGITKDISDLNQKNNEIVTSSSIVNDKANDLSKLVAMIEEKLASNFTL